MKGCFNCRQPVNKEDLETYIKMLQFENYLDEHLIDEYSLFRVGGPEHLFFSEEEMKKHKLWNINVVFCIPCVINSLPENLRKEFLAKYSK